MATPTEIPPWLSHWSPEQPVQMTDFFASHLVYYPGSGTDGQPVQYFGSRHAAHCFVFVDYGIERARLLRELGEEGHPFLGYATVGRVALNEQDLAPQGWAPHITARGARRDMRAAAGPYAFLEILERRTGFDDSHGPGRLAILFLLADGVAAYDALFCQGQAGAPFALVLQDHGFGGNWTRFGRGGALDELASQTQRKPEFLLVADNTDAWDGYAAIGGTIAGGGGMHGYRRQLWRRT